MTDITISTAETYSWICGYVQKSFCTSYCHADLLSVNQSKHMQGGEMQNSSPWMNLSNAMDKVEKLKSLSEK